VKNAKSIVKLIRINVIIACPTLIANLGDGYKVSVSGHLEAKGVTGMPAGSQQKACWLKNVWKSVKRCANPLIFVIIVQPEIAGVVIRLWRGSQEKAGLSVPVKRSEWTAASLHAEEEGDL
jgi:hypothetical protein